MALEFACPCGQMLMAAPEHAGRAIECPRCGQSTVAPAAPPVPAVPAPVVTAPAEPPRAEPAAKPWEKADAPAATTQTTGGSIEGRVFNSGMAGGVLAMVIAVVWFVLGLAADRIFFYPPILFVIGLVALLKGATQGPNRDA